MAVITISRNLASGGRKLRR